MNKTQLKHHKTLDHNVPGLMNILIMKQFWLDFIEKIGENVLFEISIFLVVLVYAITYEKYSYAIILGASQFCDE